MSQVGRNDLCPCGSGFKFKRCCLNKEQPSGVYSSGDRNSALEKLMRFAARSEFKDKHRAALELFWGDWISEEPDEKLKQVMDSEQASLAYHSWLAFDFDLGEGRTVFDLFLEREAKKLSSGECNFLDGMRGSHLRLYEILEVKPIKVSICETCGMIGACMVRERLATRELADLGCNCGEAWARRGRRSGV